MPPLYRRSSRTWPPALRRQPKTSSKSPRWSKSWICAIATPSSFFGSKAQEQLTTISDKMLEGVRNKDTGPAGAALNEMVAVLRGFDLDELDPNKKPGFFAKLFGAAKPLVKIVQQYETVRNQIDGISDALERHKTQLLTDIASLDRLYTANLDYFHTLELYIAGRRGKIAPGGHRGTAGAGEGGRDRRGYGQGPAIA
ncbi:MAG: toxic anion resistance protein [Candidatus Nanopelagicales bacterium]